MRLDEKYFWVCSTGFAGQIGVNEFYYDDKSKSLKHKIYLSSSKRTIEITFKSVSIKVAHRGG